MQRALCGMATLALLSLIGCGPDDGVDARFTCFEGSCSFCTSDGCFDAGWHATCSGDGQCHDGMVGVLGGCCWSCSSDADCPAHQGCQADGYCAEEGYDGADSEHEPGCVAGEDCSAEGEGEGEGASEGEGEGEGEGEEREGGSGDEADCDWLPPLPERCTYNSECPEGYLCRSHECVKE